MERVSGRKPGLKGTRGEVAAGRSWRLACWKDAEKDDRLFHQIKRSTRHHHRFPLRSGMNLDLFDGPPRWLNRLFSIWECIFHVHVYI